jgi:hypothetical protein
MAVAEPLGTTRHLEFALRPGRITTAFLIALDGRHGKAEECAAQIGVFPDGSLRRLTGSVWVKLSAAGVIKDGAWSDIRISATTSTASIYVNSRLVSAAKTADGTTSLAGLEVSSGGTSSVGDDGFIDNVLAS